MNCDVNISVSGEPAVKCIYTCPTILSISTNFHIIFKSAINYSNQYSLEIVR